MIKIKRLLIAVFILVAVLFAVSQISERVGNDKTPPVISCSPEVLEISVSDDESALLTGVTATDNRDGDITDKIVISGVSKLISEDTAKVTYLVFDSGDNMGSCTRLIRYTDYRRPQFKLTEPLQFKVGDTLSIEDRLFAYDVIDGDVTENIRVSTLDLTGSAEGVYYITVQVVNSMGDSARLSLPVVVGNTTRRTPVIELTEYITYVEENSRFDPESYVQSVTVNGSDGEISRVEWSGEVDTSVSGEYQVTYTYTSSDGASGSVILIAVVE
jgi:hypothetical protein